MPETDSVDDETVVEKPETEVEAPETEEAEKPEEEEGVETEEGEEEPAPSRREKRVTELARRTKEAEERAIRAEAERDTERRSRQPQTNPDETRRVRDEKLALMDPQERKDFLRDEEMNRIKGDMAMTRFQMQDTLDKNQFEAEVNSNPALAKLKGDVEKMYADALAKGTFVPRLSLLDYVIGKQTREKLKAPPSKKTVAEKKAAGERVDSVKVKPMSGKSDVSGKAAADEREARMARIEAAERARGVRD